MSLSGKEKFSYGLGAVGKDMVYMLSASYILYYYQDILGVNAVAMGIILLVARVFDAFNDPFMGVIVAKTRKSAYQFGLRLVQGILVYNPLLGGIFFFSFAVVKPYLFYFEHALFGLAGHSQLVKDFGTV